MRIPAGGSSICSSLRPLFTSQPGMSVSSTVSCGMVQLPCGHTATAVSTVSNTPPVRHVVKYMEDAPGGTSM
jgi:hypothetical protein